MHARVCGTMYRSAPFIFIVALQVLMCNCALYMAQNAAVSDENISFNGVVLLVFHLKLWLWCDKYSRLAFYVCTIVMPGKAIWRL